MHDVCIGIPASEFSRIDKYYCLLCIAKTPSLRITYSRPSMPSKSSTDVLLEKLIQKLDALCDGLAKVTSRVDVLEQQESSAPAANRYGQPPQQPFDVAAIASRVLAEQQSAEKKKLSAVIERLPEQSAEEDIAVVTEIAERCGVKDELNTERIHRHGREQPERGRIIKVPFSTSHARDKFLQNFASVKKNFYSARFPSITVRRDLTPLELQTHHALKKQAWDMNLSCKLYKFHYTNLRIVTLPDPKPLRIRDAQPLLNVPG
ncbi:hypothetical protein AAVH_22840 [Aphelenchoides avenae]|nr:hypothetical protein AAVH_22840 [Aphelenchus avenae]